jgi:hypothetical protein
VRGETPPELMEQLLAWLGNPPDTTPDAVRAQLKRWVPEYRAGCT